MLDMIMEMLGVRCGPVMEKIRLPAGAGLGEEDRFSASGNIRGMVAMGTRIAVRELCN